MHTVSPESVGLSSERLTRVDTAMQGYVDRGQLAGIITLIARKGEVAHRQVIGQRDIATNQPMQLDTIFRIYSMTKPIVSIALMMLYEQGYFHLSDPVADYIPQFKDLRVWQKQTYTGMELVEPKRPMTIQDLFSHTAGLSYGWFTDSPVEEMYRQAKPLERDISLKTMIERLAEIPLIHHPGSEWRYSVATDVLGYLIQLLTDTPLETYLQEKIFDPLGMIDTDFYVPVDKASRFASVYGPCDSGGIEVVDGCADSPFLSPPQRASGGGGLVSTTADYLNFCQMLLNNGRFESTQLVSKKTLALMTTNHLPNSLMPIHIGDSYINGYGFGLGFRVMMNPTQAQILGSVGDYGWSGAAYTHFWIDPKEALIGIFMTQFMPSGTYKAVPDFRVATYQAILE